MALGTISLTPNCFLNDHVNSQCYLTVLNLFMNPHMTWNRDTDLGERCESLGGEIWVSRETQACGRCRAGQLIQADLISSDCLEPEQVNLAM